MTDISFTVPYPYTDLQSSYPIASVVGITGPTPVVTFTNTQLLPYIRNTPLKLPNRNGTNETYTFTGPENSRVYVRKVDPDGAPDYGPWVPGITGPTSGANVPSGCTGFNMITKTYRVQNNTGTTGGNMLPNYNNSYIILEGVTGSTGSLINIAPYGQVDINDNNIFIETNCIPFDNVYGRFPLQSSITGAGRTGTAYIFPSQGGWTGPGYSNPYNGVTGQNSNVYDNNPNFNTVVNLQYDIPRYPTIGNSGTQLAWGPIGFSFRNTPFFTALSEDGYDAVSIVALDAGFQHIESHGILHTHSTHSFINDQNGNWKISTEIKVIGFMIDGFPVVAPYLVSDGLSGYRVIQNSDLDECHGLNKQITFSINGITLTYNYFYVGTLEFPYLISALRGAQNPNGVIDNGDYFGGAYKGSVNDLLYPVYEIYDEIYVNILINPNRFIKINPIVNTSNWSNFQIYSINSRDPTAYSGLISINSTTGVLTLNNLTRPGTYFTLVTADRTSPSNTFKFLFGISVNR